MYSRLYDFLKKYHLIYLTQAGFHQHYSKCHVFHPLTKTIRKGLDAGNFACGIFVDLQKIFNTTDHYMLTKNSHCCGLKV